MGSSESRDTGSGRPDDENGDNGWVAKSVGGAAAAAAGLVLLGWGASQLASGSEDEKQIQGTKMMKAPGRDGYMARDDFERDPAGYFSGLRKEASQLASGSEDEKQIQGTKWMKKPGRDGYMDRDDFERDPADYFRGLRKEKK